MTTTTQQNSRRALSPRQLTIRNNAIVRAAQRGQRGVQTTLARKYGLTRARISQIVSKGIV